MEVIRVILVDDEEQISKAVKRGLLKFHDRYEITLAASGAEALGAMADQVFHVMVTDIHMPDMDGIELINAVVALEQDIQPIVITGHGDMKTAVEAMRSGAVNFLKKPFETEALHWAIVKAWEKRELIVKLKRNEMRFRNMFEQHRLPMLLLDPENGAVFDTNSAAADFFGFSRKTFQSMNIRDIPFKSPESIENKLQKLTGDECDGVVIDSMIQGRHERACEIYAGSFEVEDRPLVFSIFVDVTDRLRFEASLKRESEINAAFAELSKKLIRSSSIKDIGHIVLEYAQRFTNSPYGFVGYIEPDTGYLVSTTLTETIYQQACRIEEKSVVFKTFSGLWGWVLKHKKTLMTNSPDDDDRSSGVPDGHIAIRRFLSAPAIVEEENEKLVGQIALANAPNDYTNEDLKVVERLAVLYAIAVRQKQMENNLKQALSRLQAAFGAIPGYIIVVDKNFNVMDINDRFLKFLNFDKKEKALGLKCYVLCKNRDSICPECTVVKVFESECVHSRLSTPQENKIWGFDRKIFSAPIKEKDGEVTGALEVGIDISDLKKMEEAYLKAKEEAERASMAKSEFLANMSHEIRTPLSGVIGMTEMIRSITENPRISEYLETVQHTADSLLRIINDILDFSKIEAGKLDLNCREVMIQELLDKLIKPFVVEASGKNVAVQMDIAENVPGKIVCDPVRLGQVLNNLMSNAVKFTDQGQIRLNVAVEGMTPDKVELMFSVADTGIGIPSKYHSSLFRVFSQVDSSYSKPFKGTGLGLVISRHLVEMMGGRIDFESEQGTGSRFYFTAVFPLSEHRQSKTAEKPVEDKTDENVVLPQLDILLAEDNPVNEAYIHFFLTDRGHRVVSVKNGKEAVQAFEQQNFQLIFMDIQMPEMDGIEASRRIRDIEKKLSKKPVPIIALTAYAMKGDKEKFLSAGMDEYVTKPVKPETLFRTMKKLVDL